MDYYLFKQTHGGGSVGGVYDDYLLYSSLELATAELNRRMARLESETHFAVVEDRDYTHPVTRSYSRHVKMRCGKDYYSFDIIQFDGIDVGEIVH